MAVRAAKSSVLATSSVLEMVLKAVAYACSGVDKNAASAGELV